MKKIALVVVLFMLSGCGGGSAGTGVFTSDRDKSTPIGSLDLAERKQLCGKIQSYFNKLVTPEVLCPYLSLRLGLEDPQEPLSSQATCEFAQPVCVDRFEELTEGLPPIECPLDLNDQSDCALPISTFEQCINDLFDETEAAYTGLSCSLTESLGSVDALLSLVDLPPPSTPACNEIRARCPQELTSK